MSGIVCYLERGEGWPRGGVDEARAAVAANQPRLGDLLDGDVGVEGDAPVLGRRRLVSLLLRPQRVGPLDFGCTGDSINDIHNNIMGFLTLS